MKKIKFYLITAICMVATVSVTSCLDDNDGDDYEYVPLTKMEQLRQLIAMEGNSSGKW